ncbi:hypothetical protein BVRB_006750 [Beta vulgaris subsp. vulgaris]|uniref:Uncharacterized protein n=1 Tax=Beta vulgaris subsp. vulgaris TaxID=3555 RepID=A0A0J8B745_BETVV|nr:hypothetical protein BVRB_006750 [Beta vulgaris subsp. vulgaris]
MFSLAAISFFKQFRSKQKVPIRQLTVAITFVNNFRFFVL